MEIVLVALIGLVLLALSLGVQALVLRLAAGWFAGKHIDWPAAFGTVIAASVVSSLASAVLGAGFLAAVAGFVVWTACIALINGFDAMTSLSIAFGMTILSVVFALALFVLAIAMLGVSTPSG